MQINLVAYRINLTSVFMRKLVSLTLLGALTLFNTACSSAPQHKLEPFNFKDATRIFREQQHDTPGVWFCGYRDHKTSENTPNPEALLVEIDEEYLYIKHNNNITELTRSSEEENPVAYTNTSMHLSARITIVNRNNFSEYDESHDRTVDVEINSQGNTYSLQLFGEGCGI